MWFLLKKMINLEGEMNFSRALACFGEHRSNHFAICIHRSIRLCMWNISKMFSLSIALRFSVLCVILVSVHPENRVKKMKILLKSHLDIPHSRTVVDHFPVLNSIHKDDISDCFKAEIDTKEINIFNLTMGEIIEEYFVCIICNRKSKFWKLWKLLDKSTCR